ncbi:MAG: 2-dehydropantoate 2-reductase N-terminal domain-containing protein [Syntrophales bacterium]
MKILLIGTGNVGLMHGWVLSEAGVDVTHVVHKGSLGKHAHDIQMDVMDMRRGVPEKYMASYSPKVVDEVSPNDSYDLVIVATNHLQAVDAVKEYKDKTPSANFLMYCANWNGLDEFDALLGRRRYLWGYSVFSGAKGSDGLLYANIQGTYRIGELPGGPAGMLDKINETFSKAQIKPDIKENIIEWLWIHFAVNAGMLGTILVEGAMPSSSTPLDVWVFIIRSVRDALNVLEARGVNYRNYPDTKVFQIENDEQAARMLREGMMDMPHYERTMAHSHVHSNPGEMKSYYLDVVETGERLGVPIEYLGSIKDKIRSL